MVTRELPPEARFFEPPRPSAGQEVVAITLGPLSIAMSGLDAQLSNALFDRFKPYSSNTAPQTGSDSDADSGGLSIELGLEDADYFIEPPPRLDFNKVLLDYDPKRDRVRFAGYRVAGWFETKGGRGVVLLARGNYEPADRALENYIRAAVAWQAASRGGALVHAASAVLDGKGFLFYGESGAGKSTLAACNRRARIVSDDLSLILPGDDGKLELVGSPFRGTYTEGKPVVGQFPLAAGFRIVKAEQAAVREVPRVRALAELVGNLPFVAEAFHHRPDLFSAIQNSLASIPLAHLDFSKDDTYWDAIATAGLVPLR